MKIKNIFGKFQPLELDWLKLKLTEGGIKCSIQKLMDFLDEKVLINKQRIIPM